MLTCAQICGADVMVAYIPQENSVKKREFLEKRERALRLAIQRKLPEIKLLKAVHDVRQAQLALIKSLLHWHLVQKMGKVPDATRTKSFYAATELWTNMTVDQIIKKYS